ncbi:restriction endonuclease subunit S [Anaerococcus sp. Marseille-Q5996]|uniref:restriction endonuclease subunit S n=1 Tax=Anaerococcus sp. Marseille-Q5996 TaxID=2972769 RepID=UPI0021CA6CC6|nr:restriction endonuclease subunit S [Anaerococcus sp. Marseille-Q5996]
MEFEKINLYKPKFYNDWDTKTLYELADWINGKAFKKKDYSNNGIPIIKIAELNNGISSNTKYTNSAEDKFYLKEKDLLFAWSGNPDTSIDTHRFNLPEGYLNQHIFKVIPNQDEISSNYFYYLMKYLNPNFKEIARNKQTTGLGHVTVSDIKNVYVNIPKLEFQDSITGPLYSIDRKIEINNKIIENLEAQAQAIFKSWFVDFEPFQEGNFIESELGLIPEGWEVKEIKEISDRKNGYTYKSSDLSDYSSVNMVTIKNFNRHGGQNDDAKKPIKNTERVKKHHILKDKDILVACTDLTQAADIIGRVILYSDNNYFDYEIYSMDVVKLVPHDITDTYFIYHYLNSNIFKGYAEGVATGTTVLHLPKKSIDSFKLIYPSKEHIEKFNEIIKPFIELENLLRNENYSLAQTRDTLLPKLMSGEIDVSNIKIDDEDIDYE